MQTKNTAKPHTFSFRWSLEKTLICFALLSCLLSSVACYILLDQVALHQSLPILGTLCFIALFGWLFMLFYRTVINSFHRNQAHLDAILNEDYNQIVKPSYPAGCVNTLQQQLIALSESLYQKKSRYDQHVFLVYQLIAHFNVPIVVLDQRDKLDYANQAYGDLKGMPWQSLRHMGVSSLGLVFNNGQWQFSDVITQQHWQIRHSEFVEQGQTHQLLVMINISSALRESQLNAWQQIIRVLGHEIRNSLTPVASMAESLASQLTTERQQQALGIISERCNHLNEFVGRYASINQRLTLTPSLIDCEPLIEQIKLLYPKAQITAAIDCSPIYADRTFLFQVLINLIKNAVEASAEPAKISVNISAQISLNTSAPNSRQKAPSIYQIIVKDCGQGLANPDNIFVPFYTTKQGGQGIGLSFCRNIIEQHGGSLTLTNNTDQPGASATILLPYLHRELGCK